jgi:hypothetical protein
MVLLTSMIILAMIVKSQPSFSFAGGVKLMKADTREVTLWYIDESPSMDNLYKTVEQTGNMAINFNLRLQDNSTNSTFHFFIEGQGYIGSMNGMALNTGLFYRSDGSASVKLQPEMSLILGYSSKSIGEIENNDVYIQVNDTKFQDYTNVNVALRNFYYGIKPGLSFTITTANDNEFGIGINYQLSLKSGKISFTGKGDDGNSAADSEKLSESNVGFYVDNKESDEIPYNADGLEIKIFYSW